MLYYLKLRDGSDGRIETVGAGEGMGEVRQVLAGTLAFLLVHHPEWFDAEGRQGDAYWGVYGALAADRVEEAVERWNTRNLAGGGNYLSLVGADGRPVMTVGGDCYYQRRGQPDVAPEQEGAYARYGASLEAVEMAGRERYGVRLNLVAPPGP